MRCFYVLVHGKLDWSAGHAHEADQPNGFYCHRYVLAQTELDATEKAFRRVQRNLDDWLRDRLARLTLEAEEVAVAPMYKLLKPENRGHAFYQED